MDSARYQPTSQPISTGKYEKYSTGMASKMPQSALSFGLIQEAIRQNRCTEEDALTKNGDVAAMEFFSELTAMVNNGEMTLAMALDRVGAALSERCFTLSDWSV